MKTQNTSTLVVSTIRLAVLSIATALFVASATAGSNNPKFAADLDTTSAGPQDVIVTYSHTPTVEDAEQITKRGGNCKTKPNRVNTISVNAPTSSLEAIGALPNVAYISPDRKVKPTLDYTTAAVNANVAFQSGFIGTGIGIAIIDSGVNPHPDLKNASGKSRIVYSESFVPGDSLTIDEYGHGTHVAGIAAGDGAVSTGAQFTHTFRGLAPGANPRN